MIQNIATLAKQQGSGSPADTLLALTIRGPQRFDTSMALVLNAREHLFQSEASVALATAAMPLVELAERSADDALKSGKICPAEHTAILNVAATLRSLAKVVG